ncbi:acyl-CoA dehydrogenase family protein, partial [candidate division WOR-3 bacterium]|nr:acyl-CoA dehydrogenase family protein [candidate division WOR-3 bacterium]
MILEKRHDDFRAKLREFAEGEVAPRAPELDKKDEFPWDLVKRMAELDLMAIYV